MNPDSRGDPPAPSRDQGLEPPLGSLSDGPPAPFHSLRVRAGCGVVVEILICALLIGAWALDRPGSDEYGQTDTMILAALAAVFMIGLGWQLSGGWGCLVGCVVQLVAVAAFVAMVVFLEGGYNPHMDNWCNGRDFDQCISNAQRNFKLTYALFIGVGVLSAVFLLWKGHSMDNLD